MSWQNNNGGGPKNPWGQGPQGRGPQPPNIDDIIKKGQQRLKDTLPGGGNGLWIGLAVLVAAWVFACLVTINQEERGVVLRFGAYDRTLNPGLSVRLWPIESVIRVPVERRMQTDIGLRPAESLMLTRDENIVDIKFTVFWKVRDPQNYLFNIQSPQDVTVKAVSESAIREVIGNTNIDFALTDGKAQIMQETAVLVQRVLDSYEAGVEVENVNLDVADPPQQVIEAFKDVQKAEADKERFQNEADRYRFQVTLEAEGEAAKIREAAQAYKQQAIAKAEGEASRFSAVYNEYKLAKNVTKKRIYLETMGEILNGMDKVILDANSGSGIVPYLPLPEIQKQRQQAEN